MASSPSGTLGMLRHDFKHDFPTFRTPTIPPPSVFGRLRRGSLGLERPGGGSQDRSTFGPRLRGVIKKTPPTETPQISHPRPSLRFRKATNAWTAAARSSCGLSGAVETVHGSSPAQAICEIRWFAIAAVPAQPPAASTTQIGRITPMRCPRKYVAIAAIAKRTTVRAMTISKTDTPLVNG